MSRPSRFHNEQPPAESGDDHAGRSPHDYPSLSDLASSVRMVSFWAAVALPFLHVPLLAAGLSTPSETLTFLGLLGLNLVALLVGHSHNAE